MIFSCVSFARSFISNISWAFSFSKHVPCEYKKYSHFHQDFFFRIPNQLLFYTRCQYSRIHGYYGFINIMLIIIVGKVVNQKYESQTQFNLLRFVFILLMWQIFVSNFSTKQMKFYPFIFGMPVTFPFHRICFAWFFFVGRKITLTKFVDNCLNFRDLPRYIYGGVRNCETRQAFGHIECLTHANAQDHLVLMRAHISITARHLYTH